MASENPTFVQLFSTLIARKRMKMAEEVGQVSNPKAIPLKQVYDAIFKETQVSVRNLGRLRTQKELPERSTLQKLENAFPELGAYREAVPILANWSIVELHQQKLPKRSTITVVSGWGKPLVLFGSPAVAEVMALQIAKNVLERETSYVFLVPKTTSKKLNDVTQQTYRRVVNVATSENTKLNTNIDWLQYPPTIQSRVHFFSATMNFPWHMFPRYSVLYNVGTIDAHKFRSYGMYWERGATAVIDPSNIDNVPELEIGGWTYFNRHDFAELSALIQHTSNFKLFPLPGQS